MGGGLAESPGWRKALAHQQLARKTGLSDSTLPRLEMGDQNIALKTLEHLCDRFRCSISDIFGGTRGLGRKVKRVKSDDSSRSRCLETSADDILPLQITQSQGFTPRLCAGLFRLALPGVLEDTHIYPEPNSPPNGSRLAADGGIVACLPRTDLDPAQQKPRSVNQFPKKLVS
jgi:DNA-binding Xre family transcriptional regulator